MSKRSCGGTEEPLLPQLSRTLVVRIASFAELSCVPALAAAGSWLNDACSADDFWRAHTPLELVVLRCQIQQPLPHRVMLKQYAQKEPAAAVRLSIGKFAFAAVLKIGDLVLPCQPCKRGTEFLIELGDADAADDLFRHMHGVQAVDLLQGDEADRQPCPHCQVPELVLVERGTGFLSRRRLMCIRDQHDIYGDGMILFRHEVDSSADASNHHMNIRRLNMSIQFGLERDDTGYEDSYSDEVDEADAAHLASRAAADAAQQARLNALQMRREPPFLSMFESASGKAERELPNARAQAARRAHSTACVQAAQARSKYNRLKAKQARAKSLWTTFADHARIRVYGDREEHRREYYSDDDERGYYSDDGGRMTMAITETPLTLKQAFRYLNFVMPFQ